MIFRRNKSTHSDSRKAALTEELEELKKEINERLVLYDNQPNQNLVNDLPLVYQGDKPKIVEMK